MKIGQKIRIGILLILGLSAWAGLLAIQSTRSLQKQFERVSGEFHSAVLSLQALRAAGFELALDIQNRLMAGPDGRPVVQADRTWLSRDRKNVETQLVRYLESSRSVAKKKNLAVLESVEDATRKLLETSDLILSATQSGTLTSAQRIELRQAMRSDLEAFLHDVNAAIDEKTQELKNFESGLRSQMDVSTRNVFIVGAGGVVTTIILGVLFSRKISEPLVRLTVMAREIGKGRLGQTIEIKSSDEMAELAAAVNDMSRDLMIARDELAAERAYTEDIIASMADSLFVLSRDGFILRVNREACQLLGVGEEELLGQNLRTFISDNMESSGLFLGNAVRNLECRFKSRSAGEVPVLLSVSTLSGFTPGRKEAMVCVATDISARKTAEDQILYMAYHDSLTALPNRALFLDRLGQAMAQADRLGTLVAVYLIGLDNFKQINESLGHRIGDLVLQAVAERLVEAVRKVDTIARQDPEGIGGSLARMGGDEYTALSIISHAEDAAKVARRILQVLQEPLVLEEQEIYLSASVGIAIYPVDARLPDDMIMNADAAMHNAKEQGKNTYKFFQHSMNVAAFKRLSLEGSLRKALERGEFVLYYQPQMELLAGNVVGFEALIRWRHVDMGMVSPDDFIPLAEETGLIGPIGEWVLREACRQCKIWQSAGYPPVTVSVNLSGKQFREKNLSRVIEKILGEMDLRPEHFGLEITESILMQDSASTIAILHRLHSMGLKLSVDDFGTGYSSLSYLKKFPLDAIKIDRSFTRDVTSNADDAAITRAISAMAKSLKLKVVAEGVETAEQLTFLRNNDCHEIQGYLLSRPQPAEDVIRILDPATAARHEGLRICRNSLGFV